MAEANFNYKDTSTWTVTTLRKYVSSHGPSKTVSKLYFNWTSREYDNAVDLTLRGLRLYNVPGPPKTIQDNYSDKETMSARLKLQEWLLDAKSDGESLFDGCWAMSPVWFTTKLTRGSLPDGPLYPCMIQKWISHVITEIRRFQRDACAEKMPVYSRYFAAKTNHSVPTVSSAKSQAGSTPEKRAAGHPCSPVVPQASASKKLKAIHKPPVKAHNVSPKIPSAHDGSAKSVPSAASGILSSAAATSSDKASVATKEAANTSPAQASSSVTTSGLTERVAVLERLCASMAAENSELRLHCKRERKAADDRIACLESLKDTVLPDMTDIRQNITDHRGRIMVLEKTDTAARLTTVEKICVDLKEELHAVPASATDQAEKVVKRLADYMSQWPNTHGPGES